jgi:uncharacterized protein YdeI (YjbR/CyaY-like superfamily)
MEMRKLAKEKKPEQPIVGFESPEAWETWLEANHGSSPGVWLKIAKKGSATASVTYDQALETALCYGWIDGQKKGFDDAAWLQKFTPRGPRSIWSKINREKVERLSAAGRMRPAGTAAVERAKEDGRWEAAYDGQSTATVPHDLRAALDASPRAGEFFATLNGANRYAILFRVQTAKKPETREKRIRDFIAMLERGETMHPGGSMLSKKEPKSIEE